MFFGGTAAKEELIDVLSRRIEDQKEYIRYLEACEMFIAKFAGAMGMEDQAPFWELTTKLGRKVCQAEAEWAREAIETIDKLDPHYFRHTYGGQHDETMHVKEAMEVLDRVGAVLPVAASSKQRVAKQQAKEESDGTQRKAR